MPSGSPPGSWPVDKSIVDDLLRDISTSTPSSPCQKDSCVSDEGLSRYTEHLLDPWPGDSLMIDDLPIKYPTSTTSASSLDTSSPGDDRPSELSTQYLLELGPEDGFTTRARLNQVPSELLLGIVEKLPAAEWLSLRLVNRRFREVVDRNIKHLSKAVLRRERTRMEIEVSRFDFTGLALDTALRRFFTIFDYQPVLSGAIMNAAKYFASIYVHCNSGVFSESEVAEATRWLLVWNDVTLAREDPEFITVPPGFLDETVAKFRRYASYGPDPCLLHNKFDELMRSMVENPVRPRARHREKERDIEMMTFIPPEAVIGLLETPRDDMLSIMRTAVRGKLASQLVGQVGDEKKLGYVEAAVVAENLEVIL